MLNRKITTTNLSEVFRDQICFFFNDSKPTCNLFGHTPIFACISFEFSVFGRPVMDDIFTFFFVYIHKYYMLCTQETQKFPEKNYPPF